MLDLTELGNRLKEARLAKGLSLDDLQELTKIQKRYLLGIEEGNYQMMPGKFYVRAFIKQYAEAVGLEPEQLFDEFKGEVPSTMNDEVPSQLSRASTKKAITSKNSKIIDLLPKIVIALLIIGVFVFVWYIAQKSAGNSSEDPSPKDNNQDVTYEESIDLKEKKQPAKEDKSVDKAEKTQEKLNDDDTGEPLTPVQELTAVETKGQYSTFELKNAEKFIVKVVSTGETWVNIRNNKGQSFFQGMLKKGETESQTFDLTQEQEITVVAGRSTETEIYVNDQKLEYAVSPSEKVRQDITIRYVKTNE